MKPDDYRDDGYGGGWGVEYQEPPAIGYTVIDVLPFLNGRPWDEIALAYVHALRPRRIRVTSGSVKLDAQSWRVTVALLPDNRTIRKITQEVQVGLPDGVAHGHALGDALQFGLNSEQVKWHQDATAVHYDGISGTVQKRTASGEWVDFPDPPKEKAGER